MWIRWYADYPDPNNQQWQVFYGKHTSGKRQVWENDAFDQLVNDAKGVTDEKKRMQMYQDADKVMLEDGSEVLGVLGEPILVEGQREITQHGGWRAYVASRKRSIQ